MRSVLPMCVADVPGEEFAVVALGDPWRVAWELLVVGPFSNCLLPDAGCVRNVTLPALLCSAARHSSRVLDPLCAEDFEPLPILPPDMTLVTAAQLVVLSGWTLAVVREPDLRLLSPRSVVRAMLNPHRLSAVENPSRGHRGPRTEHRR